MLRPGAPSERRLAGGEAHVYRAELAAGAWRLVVAQRGVDVVTELVRPDGSRLGPFNSPSGRQGAESLLVTVETAGTVGIEVRPSAAAEGSYRIEVEAFSDANPQTYRAEAAMTEAARLYAEGSADARRQAREQYRRALADWQALGDSHGETCTLAALAVISRQLGETREALELFRRALSGWRGLGDRQGEAFTLNALGLVHDRLGESRTAHEVFEQALPLWQELEDKVGEASTRSNLCLVLQRQGEFPAARTCYEEALELFRQLADPEGEATVLANLGGVHWNLGEPEPALASYHEALAKRRALGDRQGEASVRSNLALLHLGLGDSEQALLEYRRALGIYRDLENRFWEARVLSSLGYTHLGLGELERAEALLEQALALRRAVGDRRGEAITLRNLGRVYNRRDQSRQALEVCREALVLSRGLGDRRGEATALGLLGESHAALGDVPRALAVLDEAAELQHALGDRRQEAEVLVRKGKLHRRLGDVETALVSLRRAEQLYRAVGDPAGEMQALEAAARAERDLGRSDRARADVDAALELLESVRTRAGEPSRRAAFLGAQRGIYELHVDLLMERHRGDPDAGYDLEALEASERARARALLDLVTEAGACLDLGIEAGLGQRLRAAERRLTAQTRRQLTLLGGKPSETEAAEVERDVYDALSELESVRAEIRRHSPRYAALTRPRLLTAAAIQALLEPRTLVLEYLLGEERGFLWAVDRDSVESFELPGREEIEALARQTHADLADLDLRTGSTSKQAAAELARRVLGPVAARLEPGRRLVIVADGALHYLPFAVLPHPSAAGAELPLVAEHEVVHLPSASALDLLRRQLGGRPPAPKTLAVMADPVFDATDPRGRPRSQTSAGPPEGDHRQRIVRAAEGSGLTGLGRLPSSGREAAAIAALVPDTQRLLALGFDARRSRVMSGELAQYRIVHFATHGLVNPRRPGLSGLVLSQLDADGGPQNGFLGLYDVFGLELGADLVVLSGCRTALGREVRGEGLVGLTRAFMSAGVPRVVASLWQVEDQATTELMKRFYRAMLLDGLRPAAALRAAQLSIRETRRWRDPFFWGAFVLQGDWK